MDEGRPIDRTRHQGRTALVTGAASGIGRATVKRLAAEGARIVACDLDEDRLVSLRDGATAAGGSVAAVVADITSQRDIDAVVDVALALGPLDLLANVAGIGDTMLPVGEVDDATWDAVLAVNATGPMRLCRRVVPLMRKAGAGAIVNVSSIAGLSGGAGGVAYTASKHALIGITRSIAYLYGPDGIRCNAVCPGAVLTRIGRTASPTVPWVEVRMKAAMARNPGFADADHIAALISWLASAEANNINGAVISSDGGWMSA